RDRDLDEVAQVGPVAEHSELADIGRAIDAEAFHALRRRGESFLPEWFAAGNHEDHVIGHQAEHGYGVARAACLHPAVDQVANGTFVGGHGMLADFEATASTLSADAWFPSN